MKANPAPAFAITRTQRMTLIAILGGWIGACVFQVVVSILANNPQETGGLKTIIARIVLQNVPYALYCIVQLWLFWSVGIERLGVAGIARRLLVASLVAFLPLVVFESSINTIILGPAPWSRWPQALAAYQLYWIYDYIVFVGCFAATLAPRLWIGHRQAEAAREAAVRENLALRLALQEQNLQTLQKQLEPHFLFNALHAIAALVRGDNKRDALTAIATLSKLLRYAVDSSDARQSTLEAELAMVSDYLQLQSVRFGARLRYELPPVPSTLLDATLPALLLQPLVENAIRHDLECHASTCHVVITVAQQDQTLCIQIANSLHSDAARNPGSGTGLKNLRARLALAYGTRASLTVTSTPEQFLARVQLPLERDDDA